MKSTLLGSDGPVLMSHFEPTLRLEQHVSQVFFAGRALLEAHSAALRSHRAETAELLDAALRCHDIGKASPAFQAYIRNPSAYKGPSRAKQHSGLSAAAALLWARANSRTPLSALVLAQIVAGHHAGFSPIEDLDARLRADDDDLLEPQWEALTVHPPSVEVGLDLSLEDEDFESGRRWLNIRKLKRILDEMPVEEAVALRLWTQLLFSIVLEADKLYLALEEERISVALQAPRPDLPSSLVSSWLRTLPETPLNPLRDRIRARILTRLESATPCCTLTLPTGVGKTLLAAQWALDQRERLRAGSDTPARIFVVLPFLSVIDQTSSVYRQLLEPVGAGAGQSEVVMTSHSLSERQYELEGQRLSEKASDFFLDTWRSEVVLTTFDQLLLAMFSPRTRHLQRFHNLADALIILDEVQALPTVLWQLVDVALRKLAIECNSRILMMSATQPALLSEALELVGEPEEVEALFAHFRRYRLKLTIDAPLGLTDFLDRLGARSEEWISAGRRPLITLNTRASARAVWKRLRQEARGRYPVYLISADLTPADRLSKIEAIKKGEACIVVSTQTIEAGVDIDMDLTIRDFAPLDALIQVAGRCNRNNRMGDYGGEVEIVRLRSDRGRGFAEMVYDPVLLDVSHEVLHGLSEVGEEAVLALSRQYFALLKERKNTGLEHCLAFARWGETVNVRRLLRGAERQQVTFIVTNSGEGEACVAELETVLALEDRWERRSALRRLAPRIQAQSVTVNARPGFDPADFATSIGPFWILQEGRYDSEAGLDLTLDEENPICII